MIGLGCRRSGRFGDTLVCGLGWRLAHGCSSVPFGTLCHPGASQKASCGVGSWRECGACGRGWCWCCSCECGESKAVHFLLNSCDGDTGATRCAGDKHAGASLEFGLPRHTRHLCWTGPRSCYTRHRRSVAHWSRCPDRCSAGRQAIWFWDYAAHRCDPGDTMSVDWLSTCTRVLVGSARDALRYHAVGVLVVGGQVRARLPTVGTPRRYHPSGRFVPVGWVGHNALFGSVTLWSRRIVGTFRRHQAVPLYMRLRSGRCCGTLRWTCGVATVKVGWVADGRDASAILSV